jgi:aspartate racemase
MTRHDHKIIGIIGGMGPEAGCVLHSYINMAARELLNTSRDEDYPDVMHLSMPRLIPDRTEFLLGLEEVNPAIAAADVTSILNDCAKKFDKSVIACVACDTFHANPIWDAFFQKISTLDNVQMLHLVDEAVAHLKTIVSPPAKIAIFGTLGTYKERIYDARLIPLGYEVIALSHQQQHLMHQVIYDPSYGLKAHSQKTETACNLLDGVVKSLKEQGVDKIILGCTELSIIIPYDTDSIFLDPMAVAAKKLVLRSRE